MQDQITTFTFEDHVRKRPGMYIGSIDQKGIINLLEKTLVDFIELHQSDRFLFTIAMHPDFLILEVDGDVNCLSVHDILSGPSSGYMYIKALMALSAIFECRSGQHLLTFEAGKATSGEQQYIYQSNASLSFALRLDETIFTQPNAHLDFHRLGEKLKQFAMLNRGMKIIIRDHRAAYLSQTYFHYPDGIRTMFENTLNEQHSGSLFDLFIDHATDRYTYQLGIGFNRALWDSPILSFANEVNTYCHGSLLDGVIKGVIKALETYTERFEHKTYQFTPKKVKQGLTLVIAVRGKEVQWRGCTRAELFVPAVKKESSHLTSDRLLKYLNENPEHATKFISMFDVTTYVQTDRSLTHCTMACLVAQKRVPVSV
jgi:DNA gyrase/topoisomerase IV subunit B